MKQFIDLRGQGTGGRFAFYDTNSDMFETFGGEQVFESFDEFVDLYDGKELSRYEALMPEWTRVF